MSQDAGAAQSKRSQGLTYVYGPMYQLPPEREVENEKPKPKSNQAVNYLIPILIVVLVMGGVVIYLKEKGIDVRQLIFRRHLREGQIFNRAYEEQRGSSGTTQAWVIANSLYLREGPGMEFVPTYLLPENWGVSLVGDFQMDNSGEVWAKVLVQTDEGLQEGWVSRKFLQ
jgi:hypothetical protein